MQAPRGRGLERMTSSIRGHSNVARKQQEFEDDLATRIESLEDASEQKDSQPQVKPERRIDKEDGESYTLVEVATCR